MAIMNIVLKEIRPFMKDAGFQFTKKCFFRIQNDIAHCVDFEMPSGIVYVNVYLLPMYIPTENRYYTYGFRISQLKDCFLPPLLGDSQEIEAIQWCNELKKCLNDVVFPAFAETATPSTLINQLENKNFLGTRKEVCPAVWVCRLRFFTELYNKNLSEIQKVGSIYSQSLSKANFLTENAKKYYRQEIQKFTQVVNLEIDEADALCKSIIEQVKNACF